MSSLEDAAVARKEKLLALRCVGKLHAVTCLLTCLPRRKRKAEGEAVGSGAAATTDEAPEAKVARYV